MKTTLLKHLASVAFLALTIHGASATTYELGTPVKMWEVGKPGTLAGSAARSMTVSNGEIYILQAGAPGTVWYTTGDDDSKSWGSFGAGLTTPHGIASDSAGNIVLQTGNSTGNNMVSVTTLSKGATDMTSKKTVSVSSYAIKRGDFIGACGKTRNATESGYVWVAPNGGTIAKRLRIHTSGTAVENQDFSGVPFSLENINTAMVMPNRDSHNDLMVSMGGSNTTFYHLRANESTNTLTQVKKFVKGQGRPVMVGSGDQMYYIYSTCTASRWNVSKTAFTIENAVTGDSKEVVIHNDAYDANLVVGGVLLDAVLEGGRIYVYAFQPAKGAWCYSVPVNEVYEAPILPGPSDLTITTNVWDYSTSDPHRVDITFNWTAGDPGLTSVKLQRQNGSEWTTVATFDATTTSYSIDNIALNNYTYRIIGFNDSGIECPGTNYTVDSDVPKLPGVPRWDGNPRVYDGYGKVQLRWNRRHGTKPDGYDIYFDGTLLEDCYPVANYVHNNIAAGTHTYKLVSVYKNNDGTRKDFTWHGTTYVGESSEVTVNVLPTDMGLNQYYIEEVYNYRIDKDFTYPQENGSFNSWLNDPEMYRQGCFYKGYWFVAQRENATSDKNVSGDPNSKVGDGTEGAILRFDANAGSLKAMSASVIKVHKLIKGQSVGLAVDEAGNIFVNNHPTSTGGWGFSNPMKGAQILVLNSTLDGVEQIIPLDLSSLGIDNRCDYYSVKGNMMSAEGAYVYITESSSNEMYCLHIKNGVLDDWHKFDHAGQNYTVGTSAESYVFPVDGRNDVVHGLRSQGYYNVDFNRAAGTEGKVLYSTESRTSNAGGITRWYNNRMFVITPESTFSRNTGDFFLGVAASHDGFGVWASDPSTCDVSREGIMPLLTYKQTDDNDINKETYVNCNGNWYGIEEVGGDTPTEHNGFYLYQYVPGMRFAKYRIASTYSLPESSVALDVKIRYDEESDGTPYDIAALDGHVTWNTIQGFGEDEGITFRKVHAYAVELVNTDGESAERVLYDAAGSLSDKTDVDDISYVAPTSETTLTHVFENIDETVVSARVTVYFRDANTAMIVSADPREDQNSNSYMAAPVSEPSVKVLRRAFEDYGGESKMLYRVDVDFQTPDFGAADPQPRSHYQVHYRKQGETEWNVLEDLYLTSGSPNQYMRKARAKVDFDDEIEPAPDPNAIDKVPGAYNFSDRTQCLDGDNDDPAVAYRYLVADATDSSANPMTWEYKIVASYAASSSVSRPGFNSIAKDSETGTFTATDGGTTGLNQILAVDTDVKAYPLPARDIVNVSAPQGVNSVAIYSLAGSKVEDINADGSTTIAINIDHLQAGNYIMIVNGSAAVKMVKK